MMSYQVAFQKDERDIGTLYWNGSLEETQRLGRQIAIKCEADAIRIFDFSDAEVGSEKRPFEDQGSNPDAGSLRRHGTGTRKAV
jgi:hypothetical protein